MNKYIILLLLAFNISAFSTNVDTYHSIIELNNLNKLQDQSKLSTKYTLNTSLGNNILFSNIKNLLMLDNLTKNELFFLDNSQKIVNNLIKNNEEVTCDNIINNFPSDISSNKKVSMYSICNKFNTRIKDIFTMGPYSSIIPGHSYLSRYVNNKFHQKGDSSAILNKELLNLKNTKNVYNYVKTQLNLERDLIRQFSNTKDENVILDFVNKLNDSNFNSFISNTNLLKIVKHRAIYLKEYNKDINTTYDESILNDAITNINSYIFKPYDANLTILQAFDVNDIDGGGGIYDPTPNNDCTKSLKSEFSKSCGSEYMNFNKDNYSDENDMVCVLNNKGTFEVKSIFDAKDTLNNRVIDYNSLIDSSVSDNYNNGAASANYVKKFYSSNDDIELTISIKAINIACINDSSPLEFIDIDMFEKIRDNYFDIVTDCIINQGLDCTEDISNYKEYDKKLKDIEK